MIETDQAFDHFLLNKDKYVAYIESANKDIKSELKESSSSSIKVQNVKPKKTSKLIKRERNTTGKDIEGSGKIQKYKRQKTSEDKSSFHDKSESSNQILDGAQLFEKNISIGL